MKSYRPTRTSTHRHGMLWGIVVVFFSCVVLGGADPVAQIEAARAVLDKIDAAHQEESALPSPPATAAPSPEVSGIPAPTTSASGEELDYVDFAEKEAGAGPMATTRETNGTQLITVSLDDVSLEDTVRMFAQTAGANIIASGALLDGKRVTVNLRDVDWQPALRSILEIHGLSLIEQVAGSGVFSIQAKAPDAPEPTVVETFFLNFTTVGEIRDPVKGMLKSNAVMTAFPSRNALVIRSTEANLREVGVLIEQLDRPGRQVLIETKIMELSDSAMKELGVRWDALKEFGVSADIKPFSYSQKSTDTRTTEDAFHQLDGHSYAQVGRNFVAADSSRPLSSGNTDVVGGEAGATRLSPLGYDPGSETFAYDGTAVQNEQTILDQFTRQIVTEQSAILNMSSLSVILSALEEMDGVSIVSNPKMIVASGSTNAFFSVGQRDPIIESELKRGTEESPGDTITAKLATGIETDFIRGGYLKTGVDLKVVATVKTDDYIEALINPSLRRLLGFKEVKISEDVVNSWPIISLKEIGTTFTLLSGQTVAIGGLTDVQEQKVTTRVPFLGRIPILGRLFTHDEDVKKQVETIIFVTLSVADPEKLEENAGVPEDARLVHQRRLKDEVKREEHMQEIQKQIDARKASESPAEIPQNTRDEEKDTGAVLPADSPASVESSATEPVPAEPAVSEDKQPLAEVPAAGVIHESTSKKRRK